MEISSSVHNFLFVSDLCTDCLLNDLSKEILNSEESGGRKMLERIDEIYFNKQYQNFIGIKVVWWIHVQAGWHILSRWVLIAIPVPAITIISIPSKVHWSGRYLKKTQLSSAAQTKCMWLAWAIKEAGAYWYATVKRKCPEVGMNPSKTISPKSSQLGRSLSKLGYAANSKPTAPTKVAWNNRERFDSVLVRTRVIKWKTAANPAFKRASTTPTESSPPAGLRSIKNPKNQKMASNQLIRLTCSHNSGIASNMTKIWNR